MHIPCLARNAGHARLGFGGYGQVGLAHHTGCFPSDDPLLFVFLLLCSLFLKIVTLFKKVKHRKNNFDPSLQLNRFILMEQTVKTDSFTHLIAGASRGIGRTLLDSCAGKSEQVIALSRSQPDSLPPDCQWITGDAGQPESFSGELPDVIHLSLIHI